MSCSLIYQIPDDDLPKVIQESWDEIVAKRCPKCKHTLHLGHNLNIRHDCNWCGRDLIHITQRHYTLIPCVPNVGYVIKPSIDNRCQHCDRQTDKLRNIILIAFIPGRLFYIDMHMHIIDTFIRKMTDQDWTIDRNRIAFYFEDKTCPCILDSDYE